MIGHRRCLPQTTYLITKKCNDDLFLLKPNRRSRSAILYELTKRANRYRVRVHAFCFMRNHFHLVVTDTRGMLPAFMRDFLTNSSKALQLALDVDRPIWNRKRYGHVHLLDLDAAERKIAYTLLNPTRARLTLLWEWPGVTSAHWTVKDVIRTRRPAFYYSPRYNPLYVEMTLEPVGPEFGLSTSHSVFQSERRIAYAAAFASFAICVQMQKEGRWFAGPEAVINESMERRGKRQLGRVNPRFASLNRQALRLAIADLREFEDDHQRAKVKYTAGDHLVEFPAGTYGYRMQLGVRVAGVNLLG